MHVKLLIGYRNYTWASSWGIFYYLISKLIGKLIVALKKTKSPTKNQNELRGDHPS